MFFSKEIYSLFCPKIIKLTYSHVNFIKLNFLEERRDGFTLSFANYDLGILLVLQSIQYMVMIDQVFRVSRILRDLKQAGEGARTNLYLSCPGSGPLFSRDSPEWEQREISGPWLERVIGRLDRNIFLYGNELEHFPILFYV